MDQRRIEKPLGEAALLFIAVQSKSGHQIEIDEPFLAKGRPKFRGMIRILIGQKDVGHFVEQ